MIEFKEVYKSFGARQVLDGLNLRVESGEIAFVLGRSGVGKSVLLKHLVGLLQPDRGEIFVEGREVTCLAESEWFEIRRLCGMVFQFPALLDSLNVYDNVAFGISDRADLSDEDVRRAVHEKLFLVQLDDSFCNKVPAELSFGIQKRVSLARTLAIEPRYLLFDEPTTGLDPLATKAIHELIYSLSRRLKVASIVVSHDIGGALGVADKIHVLENGKIVAHGTPAEISGSRHPLVKEFLRDQ